MTREHPEAAEPSRTPGHGAEIRDGTIDFTRYSSEQLEELRYTLNQSAFPLNYANLLAEIDRRAAQGLSAEQQSTSAEAGIRFTRHDGLRGWLEAKSRRLPLYGAGFVEVRPNEIVLGGWQRNWLGFAQRAQIFVPLQDIADVVQGDGANIQDCREGDWVRFRYETALGRYRFVEFQATSIRASALVDAFPKTRSDGYERWTAVREFDARLREAGSTPWITTALVIANLAIFAAISLILQRLDLTSDLVTIAWGANFAPLTLHGQVWRLLSALFLHANVPHVLFNMWALWNVGRLTERLYGNGAFAFLYFGCGALAGLASNVWDPARATVGASGAIFGICAAFILFALHPHRRIAVKVPPALWMSTGIFTLYNLAAGFFTPGIDNAAHLGGVISGLVLGACLARPLTLQARDHFPVKRAALAVMFAAVGAVAAFWQATGFGSQLTGPERYLRNHLWYVQGESENLRKWQEIAASAASGQLSSTAVGVRFEREIVPFWQTTRTRLTKEEHLPADERQFAALIAEYARLRLDWARAVVDIAQGTTSRSDDASQDEKQANRVVAQTGRVMMLASLDHRPRALANSPWMVAMRNWLTGQRWQCAEPPPAIRPPLAAGDSVVDGPAARRAAGCRAQKLFMSGDYLALDRWIQQSAASLQDLPDGGSTFDGIFRGLSDLFQYQRSDLMQALGRTADWHRRTPDSVYPQLVQSLIFEKWAWTARGTGAAETISPQAWALFGLRTEMAAMGLRELADRADSNPLWYQLSLDVGLDQAKTPEELRAILDRGISKQPNYWPLYARMLRILMPRWLGSHADIQRFVKDVSVTPDGQRDFEKYARLYWAYSSLEDDDVALFESSLATWSVMREGFVELQHDYPHSDFIINAYAKFACMADDGDTYGEIRPQLRDHLSSVVWANKISLKHCDTEFPAALAASPDHKVTTPKFHLN